jgi:plasmid stabilization system protein ParE
VVIWTEPARNDLKAIHDFIALDSKFYAKNVVRSIVQRVAKLSSSPEVGRIVPEIDDKYTREVFLYSYRIIYQLQSEDLFILAIVHGHRNICIYDIPLLD